MTAEIIDLAAKRQPKSAGNGAREAMIEMYTLLMPYATADRVEFLVDWILIDLAIRGYQVVPL